MLDLRYLEWYDRCNDTSSYGMLNKAEETTADGHYYYKMSRMLGNKVVGFDSVYEVVASRFLDILGVPHVSYELVDALVHISDIDVRMWICKSKDYKKPDMDVMAVQDFCTSQDTAEEELLKMFGEQELYKIYLIDFLIANVDRHGGNTEIVQHTDGSFSIAPFFDNGMSLLSWAPNEEAVLHFDVMSTRDTNNFIGSKDLYENLFKIKRPIVVNPLHTKAKSYIFHDISRALPRGLINKSWELIWRRYNYAKDKNFLIERSETSAGYSSHFNSY